MAYKRVSKDKIRRHKKRAQEIIDKLDGYDTFLRMAPGHSGYNTHHRDHFEKNANSPEGNKLDSVSSLDNVHRRKAPVEIEGEGLPHNATLAFCNINNFLQYFVRNDLCIEHGLSIKDVMMLLYIYQFEYVCVSYILKSYHAKQRDIYSMINNLSKADLVRGTRIKTYDKPKGVRSSRKIKITEQGTMLCSSFFIDVQKDVFVDLPELPSTRGIHSILEENLYKKEVNPLLVKNKRRSKDEVYPPSVSKKILKDMLRDNKWKNRVSKRILKGRYKRSAMEKYKSKELHMDLKALRRELEDDEEE